MKARALLVAMCVALLSACVWSISSAGSAGAVPSSTGTQARDMDCGDFPNQAAAQAYFLLLGGPVLDPDRLDSDGDGIACESLPCPCSYVTIPPLPTPTLPTPTLPTLTPTPTASPTASSSPSPSPIVTITPTTSPTVTASPTATASPTTPPPGSMWSYRDKRNDADAWADVTLTTLDTREPDQVEVRIYGRKFQKNKTDLVVLFFDTDRDDKGPELTFSWMAGKSPAGAVGATALEAVTDFDDEGTAVTCNEIVTSANYRRVVLTVSIPRSCLNDPTELRWAGTVREIRKLSTTGAALGPSDDFPRPERFPGFWAS